MDEQIQEVVSPGDSIHIDLPPPVCLSVRFSSCNTALLSIKYTNVELSNYGVYQCVSVCELVWFYETIFIKNLDEDGLVRQPKHDSDNIGLERYSSYGKQKYKVWSEKLSSK